ncbi:iron ABC transporter substrate-binding protein [Aeromicrobium sp.]|uniref:iron ABC transporter substrate-binding protein n=1 Tax=Aeromicrobium sp. TaxID=1871063 RepID=UPI003D6BF8ED
MRLRVLAATALTTLVATTLSACGTGSEESDRFITVYNAQHEELLAELAPKFTEKTGIDVKLRNGKDFELGNQLVQEGEQTPADVFLTENSPAMSLVESKGLFAPLDQTSLDRIPEQYRPASGAWTGFVARSTVLIYDDDVVDEADLPESILDLAKPEWKGRTSFSPSGADFQAIVSAVLQLEGEKATEEWLEGIAENGTVYQGNNIVMNSVNDSQVETGIMYHYYWYRDQAEAGENSNDSRLHFFGKKDPGAFVSVSGAGVLKASQKQADAQRFVDYLTDVDGQQALADSYALEYPLNPEVELEPPVKPLSELDPPDVDLTELNGPKVIAMMQEVGLL